MKRRQVWIAISLAIVIVAVGAGVLKHQRDLEWAHGGDRVAVAIELQIVSAANLSPTMIAYGAPADFEAGTGSAAQAIAVRATWTDSSPRSGSRYLLIALDKRVDPPRLLAANQVPKAGGSNGWSGSYAVLAKHYEWLVSLQHAKGPG